jgi:hypothetical protein
MEIVDQALFGRCLRGVIFKHTELANNVGRRHRVFLCDAPIAQYFRHSLRNLDRSEVSSGEDRQLQREAHPELSEESVSLGEVGLYWLEFISRNTTHQSAPEILNLLNLLVFENTLGVFSAVVVGHHDLLNLMLSLVQTLIPDFSQFSIVLEQTIHFYYYNSNY